MAIIKTNPVYAHLAYRRSIVVQLIDELRENYMSLSSESPKKEIICGDVYQEDSLVPLDEFESVIEELEQEAHGLELQMRKFTFIQGPIPNELLNSQKAEKGNQDEDVQASKKVRRRNRGAG